MVRTLILLLFIAVILPACDGLNEEELQPGALSLASVNAAGEADNVFSLGDVKNTKAFNFYLTNSGDTDIFDVSIESSNEDFIIDPDSIPVLQVGRDLLLEQGLQVTAVHGTDASGLGPTKPMRMGMNETELRVRASTTNASGDTLSLRVRASLQVNALLADLEIYDLNGKVALDAPSGTISGVVTPTRLSRFEVADGNLRLVNTGNVALQIRLFQVEDATQFEDVMLLPGEESTVERNREPIIVRIDTDRTVTRANLLPIQLDGYVYVVCDFAR